MCVCSDSRQFTCAATQPPGAPQLRSRIHRACSDQLPCGIERKAHNLRGMPPQGVQQLARAGIPDLSCLIERAGNDLVAEPVNGSRRRICEQVSESQASALCGAHGLLNAIA